MDYLFSTAHNDYLGQVREHSTQHTISREAQAFGEPDYDTEEVFPEVRDISKLPDFATSTVASVRSVLEFLKCSICQDTACDPRVIKHCLHFFCKDCIEPYLMRMSINQQKSCPLCKAELKTKRELRGYERITKILQFLKPLIAQADE